MYAFTMSVDISSRRESWCGLLESDCMIMITRDEVRTVARQNAAHDIAAKPCDDRPHYYPNFLSLACDTHSKGRRSLLELNSCVQSTPPIVSPSSQSCCCCWQCHSQHRASLDHRQRAVSWPIRLSCSPPSGFGIGTMFRHETDVRKLRGLRCVCVAVDFIQKQKCKTTVDFRRQVLHA